MFRLARLVPLTKQAGLRQTLKSKPSQPVRNGSHFPGSYRGIPFEGPPLDTKQKIIRYIGHGVIIGAYYWVFAHMYYGYDHWRNLGMIVDPRSLSDEDLGIPPDDAEGEAFPGINLDSYKEPWRRIHVWNPPPAPVSSSQE